VKDLKVLLVVCVALCLGLVGCDAGAPPEPVDGLVVPEIGAPPDADVETDPVVPVDPPVVDEPEPEADEDSVDETEPEPEADEAPAADEE